MQNKSNATSFIVVTLDSCRWDSFQEAYTPNLDSFGQFRKAGAQATFTYASHLAMYIGIFPNCDGKDIPYYNRYTKQLFRIDERPSLNNPLIRFPEGTVNIIEGFNSCGYNTFGTGAVAWFKHPNLVQPFQDFLYTGTHLNSQLDYLENKIKNNLNTPFFALLNIGETHEPYTFGGKIPPQNSSQARTKRNTNEFLYSEWQKQIKSVTYVDKTLGSFLYKIQQLKKDVMVIVCADHGECFGEDGLYGHGFYHPKVMEVPLGIFSL